MSELDKGSLLDPCLLEGIDCALEARDDIGAIKSKVYIMTRTWEGDEVGSGDCEDEFEQVLPTPYIQDFSHDIRIKEVGSIKQGDLLLKSISMNKYPTEDCLDLTVPDDECYKEKFYYVCGKIYECVNIRRHYATWDVLIRRITSQPEFDSDRLA